MKKLIYTATALLVLAGSSASANSFRPTQLADKSKPKPTEPGPSTDSIPPVCPYNDPNGCGILD